MFAQMDNILCTACFCVFDVVGFIDNHHVYAATETDEFLLRQRLWELEERLDSHHFIRISNSEIINLRRVIAFDLSLTGTICVSLQGGQISYVSRRYVRTIRQALGL